jgi:hypothetical protein
MQHFLGSGFGDLHAALRRQGCQSFPKLVGFSAVQLVSKGFFRIEMPPLAGLIRIDTG